MVAALREGLGRRPGLIPVPRSLLAAAARLAGREEAFERLTGTLVASPTALTRLGWRPPVSTQEGLRRLARSSVSARLKSGIASSKTPLGRAAVA